MSYQFLSNNEPYHTIHWLEGLKRITSRLTLVTLLSLIFSHSTVQANPDPSNPDAYLDVNGIVPEAKPLADECVQLYETIRNLAIELPKKLDPKKIGVAYASTQRFERCYKRLRHLGEPLSHDLMLRAAVPIRILQEVRAKYSLTADGIKVATKITLELRKKEKLRQSIVAKLTELNEKESWAEAEAEWDKVMASLWPQTAYLDIAIANEFGGPFGVIEDGFSRHQAIYRRRLFHTAVEVRNAQRLAFDKALSQTLEEAPTKLKSLGYIPVDGANLTGPQAIKQFTLDFGKLHVLTMQHAALEFLGPSMGRTRGSQQDTRHEGMDQPQRHGIVLEMESKAAALQDSIRSIIASDPLTNSSSSPRETYAGHLSSIAFSMNRFDTELKTSFFSTPLLALAERANLTSDVSAYQSATDDVLQWRARVAEKMRQSKSVKDYPDFEPFIRSQSQDGTGSPGFYSPIANPIPRLIQTFAETIPRAWNAIGGKNVNVGETVRFDSEKPLFMSRLVAGLYARPEGSLISSKSIAALKKELLVDDTHPPLTLDAALALHESERGEFLGLGGKIVGMHIESSSNRILKLPPIAGSFLRYTNIQLSNQPNDEMSALAIRLDVQPVWGTTHYQYIQFEN